MAVVAASSGGSSSTSKVVVILSVLVGAFLGSTLTRIFSTTPPLNLGPKKGTVALLSETPVRNTVHVDEKGRPITKQQLLDPFVIPNFVGFSVATFKPGQTMMPVHEHESMHEIFYVVEGSGVIRVDDVDHKVKPGHFLHIAPHEKHGIWIPEDSEDGDMKMVVCGVTVGDK